MRLIRDLLIASVITTGVFFVLEFALRLAGVKFEAQFYALETDRGFGWRPFAEGWTVVEGENYVRINSDGLRDKERPVAKPVRTLRIAVVGSSEVAAEQVPLDRTFEAVLERRLNAALRPAGYRAEVLNFGVNAYNQTQDYLTIRDRIWKYRPDIVLFAAMPAMLMRNSRDLFMPEVAGTPFYDVEKGQAVPDRFTRSRRPPSQTITALRSALSSLVNRSQILLALDDLRNGLPKAFQKLRLDFQPVMATSSQRDKLSLLEQIHDPNTPKLREAWKVADALFDRMTVVCKQHRAEFWLVILSSPYSDTPRLEARRALERKLGVSSLLLTDNRLAQMASRKGVYVAPLSGEMADYAAANQVALHGFFNTSFNTGHFNTLGNAVIGRLLSRTLLNGSPILRRYEAPSSLALTKVRSFQPKL